MTIGKMNTIDIKCSSLKTNKELIQKSAASREHQSHRLLKRRNTQKEIENEIEW